MAPKSNNPDNKSVVTNTSKRIIRIFARIALGLIVVITLVFITIQTETFNNWALRYALDNLNEDLQTRDVFLNADSLNGNVLDGITLKRGSIKVFDDTLLSFSLIEVKYDLKGILDNEIRIKECTIDSPQINFSKVKDSNDSTVWNFSKLISSSAEPDTQKSDFDGGLIIDNLKIRNGKISVKGQLEADTPLWKRKNERMKEFDLNNSEIGNLDLELSARYFPDHKTVAVKNLSFDSNSELCVRKLEFTSNFNRTDTISELQNFTLITDRCDIRINRAMLSSFDLFESNTFENLGSKDVEADIDIRKFNFDELRFFLPSVDMLDSTVALKLNANGKYGDLRINSLNLRLPNSEINLTGNLKKLDDAANLLMDVRVHETSIFPKDVNTIVKISSIPDYSNIGTIYPEVLYTGTYREFFSKLELTTSAGKFSGHIDMDLPAEEYSGRLVVTDLNPGKILKEHSVEGDVNIAAEFSCDGFDPNVMNAKVEYDMTNSEIAGYDIKSSSGKLKLNRKQIELDIRLISSIGNAAAKGSVNLSSLNNPAYKIKGTVSNLNIAAFTKSPDDKSNLNFSYDLNGKGIKPEELNGRYDLSFETSYYGSFEIPQIMLSANVKNTEAENVIDINSDAADFKAVGKFSIVNVMDAVVSNIAAASENLSAKLGLDSVPTHDRIMSAAVDAEDFSLDYSLVTKDPVKAGKLLAPLNVKFIGSSTGLAQCRSNILSISSVFDVPAFAYRDTVVVFEKFTSALFFSNDHNRSSAINSLDGLKLNLNASSDNVIIGNSALSYASVAVDLVNSSADVTASAGRDSTLSAHIHGMLDMNAEVITSAIDSISVKYGRFRIENSGDWVLTYLPYESIKIQQMRLESGSAAIDVSGTYSFNSSSDVSIKGNEMKLVDLVDVFYEIDSTRLNERRNYPVQGLLNQFSVNYRGTPLDPELSIIANTSELKYQDKPFGTISAKSVFKDNNALLDISMVNEGKEGSLTVFGNLPVQNPFISDSSAAKIDDNPVSLKMKADDFQYEYFLKMIPGMLPLKGVLNGEFAAGGTASSPDLKGSMKVSGGSFYFGMTGMNYSYDFLASAENTKLLINDFKLFNSGDKGRHIDIRGNVDLAGLKLNDIDLQTSGDMVILDEDIEWNELDVYGYVLAGIGNPGVSIKGNQDKIKMSGQLIVKEAKISSIPEGNSGYDVKKDNFTYDLIPAQNHTVADTVILIAEDEFYKLDPFIRSKYIKDKMRSGVAEFLDIDIDLRTEKSIYALLNFDRIPMAKLYGELKANLNLKSEDEVLKAKGNIDVIGNSYFQLYKDFKLKDSRLIFDGMLLDPVLDIQAVHTGSKVSEQYGNSASTEVQIKLAITGKASDPKVKLMLIENGSEITGSNAQSDAVSYLLYGKFKSELTESERSSVASAIGAAYVSQYVLDVVREILPFFTAATFNVGDKPLKEIKNFEFSVDYPLNDLLRLNLPETLMMEFFREELDDIFSIKQTTMNTGLKIIYKVKF